MGCKHSKHAPPEPEQFLVESKATSTKYGIECSTESDHPVFDSEETPQQLRKIRAELFSKDSSLAFGSSATSSETTSYHRSFGSNSTPSQDSTHHNAKGEGGGCHFIDFSRNHSGNNNNNNNDDDDDESTQLHQRQRTQSKNGSRASFDGGQYHYPAALYDKMKTQRHFVPTTSTTGTGNNNKIRQPSSVPSLPSGATTCSAREGSEEGSSSFVSSQGYISNIMTEEENDSQLLGNNDNNTDNTMIFPQFEALVDTMALSLEPLDASQQRRGSSYRNNNSVLSLGALVDQLTEEGDFQADSDKEEEFISRMLEEEETIRSEMMIRISRNKSILLQNGGTPTVAPSSNSRYRVPTTATARPGNSRHSVPPMLEQNDSSEMLASMKTMALMAGVQDILAPSNKHGSNRCDAASDEDGTEMGFCPGINSFKFRRSVSVAPSSSASVCSELRWGA